MEIIDRYIHAVIRRLPQSQREEVARELRATIEDMVADRARGKKPNRAVTEMILKELGHPEVLALRYSDTSAYLIGPKWSGAYWRVLVRLLSIIPVVVAVIMFGVGLLEEGMTLGHAIAKAVGAGIGAVVQVGFWTTLVFALLERSSMDPAKIMGAEWQPDDLPDVPKKRQIARSDTVANIVLTVLAIVATVALTLPRASGSVQVLNPELWNVWIPVFLGLGAASIGLEAAKYRVGRWTRGLVGANIVFNIVVAVYVIVLVFTQQVVNPVFVQLVSPHGSGEWVQWAVGITAVAIVTGSVASAVTSVYKSRQ